MRNESYNIGKGKREREREKERERGVRDEACQ